MDKVKQTLGRLREMSVIKNKSAKIDELLNRMNKVCPNTAESIMKNWNLAGEKFKNWEQAWRWNQWNSF